MAFSNRWKRVTLPWKRVTPGRAPGGGWGWTDPGENDWREVARTMVVLIWDLSELFTLNDDT